MVIATVLKEALNDAISSGKFIDTKIILFSRRDSSGRICKPKALYANSHVLKSVPYFDDLLSGPFSESEAKDFSEPIDEGEFAEDYGYSSDSDLEEDSDFGSPAPKPRLKAVQPEALYGKYKEHIEMGKVIKIRDVAFITFQAFLLYLYTKSIRFASFGSKENRKSRSSEIAWISEEEIPKPSPKSIYRLADKYDIPGLKKTALKSIEGGLQKCDIVQETFSVFTSRYKEIRTMEVKHFLHIWLSGSEEESGAVRKGLEEKIDRYAAGELGHAADAISWIWAVSNEDGLSFSDSPSPSRPSGSSGLASSLMRASTTSVAVAKTFLGCDIRGPLIKSIKEGYLLDRKYWVRRSREGAVEPIYFASTVAWADVDGVLGRQLGCEGHLDDKDEDEYTEDSDYENEAEKIVEPVPQKTESESEQQGEQKLLSVLKFGSSVAWKSLFFYVLTGEIRFAPLMSRGSENRSKWVLANTKSSSPTPCSPKTIYQLVKKLTWKDELPKRMLVSLALNDIEAKLTEENITAETFSSFAARYPELMVLGWTHLGTNLKTEKTTTSVLGLIRGMEGGEEAHRADALKFGLYNALRLKAPAPSTFALLQCTDEKCSANAKPISYSALAGGIVCPKHSFHVRPLKCSECGHARVDRCSWCKGCRRLF